jgi:hypothetical protein
MPLCDYCQKFDLYNKPKKRDQTYWIGSTTDVEDRAEECNFCALIMKASLSNDYGPGDQIWLQPTNDGYNIDRTGCFLVPMAHRDDVPKNPRGYGRIVSGRLHSSTIKNWLDICQHGTDDIGAHAQCKPLNLWAATDGASQNLSGPKALKWLRLFNVENKKIEDFYPGSTVPPYVALSYSQGGVKKPDMVKTDIDFWMKHPMRQSDMAQTHWDAVSLVRDLKMGNKLKHVWIDELCLYGDGVNDPSHAVNNMDRIYAAALFTVIAADGNDAHSGLTATTTQRRKVGDQMRTKVLPGVEWGVVRTVYNHMGENNVYSTRGWTYQELVLSHRCLVFANGMAFWLCRERMFSEDTFLDEYPSHEIPSGMAAEPLDISFQWIDRDIDDPLAMYARCLGTYRARDMNNPDESRDGFLGILNRVTNDFTVKDFYGLPRVFFHVALVWWHRPDINVNRNVHRNFHFPSWSWMGWKEGIPSQFVPYTIGQDNYDYVLNNTDSTYYWCRGPKVQSLEPVWTSSAQDDVDNKNILGAGRTFGNPTTPSLGWTGIPDVGMLQFDATWLRNFQVDFSNFDYGIGEISTGEGELVGVCYADDQRGDDSLNYFLIQLCEADNCYAFDSSGKLYMNINGTKQNKEEYKFYIDPPLQADRKLCWVMVVKAHSIYGSQGVYERVGLGWVKKSKLSLLQPGPGMIVIG